MNGRSRPGVTRLPRGAYRTAMLATVAIALVAATAPAAGTDPRLRLDVALGDQAIRATSGSYCLQTPLPGGVSSGVCADSAYPLKTRGRLTLKAGGTLRLTFGGRPTSVRLRMLRGTDLQSTVVLKRILVPYRGDRRRYRLRLPQRLRCARIADVFVRYADGDADFWAAVRAPRCTP